MENNDVYHKKYLKYKLKYLNLLENSYSNDINYSNDVGYSTNNTSESFTAEKIINSTGGKLKVAMKMLGNVGKGVKKTIPKQSKSTPKQSKLTPTQSKSHQSQKSKTTQLQKSATNSTSKQPKTTQLQKPATNSATKSATHSPKQPKTTQLQKPATNSTSKPATNSTSKPATQQSPKQKTSEKQQQTITNDSTNITNSKNKSSEPQSKLSTMKSILPDNLTTPSSIIDKLSTEQLKLLIVKLIQDNEKMQVLLKDVLNEDENIKNIICAINEQENVTNEQENVSNE
jgi:hypothetical protein